MVVVTIWERLKATMGKTGMNMRKSSDELEPFEESGALWLVEGLILF